MAAVRRQELIEERVSFVDETVFSHESKLRFVEEAKRSGFRVWLNHLGVSSAELAIARIATRDTSLKRRPDSIPSSRVFMTACLG